MFTFITKNIKQSSGVFIIELMISVVIGLILLGMLMGIYIAIQRHERLQHAMNKMQNNAKSVFSLFRYELHHAGQIGCPRLSADFPVRQYPGYSITANNKLYGTDKMLEIRHAAFPNVVLEENMQEKTILYASRNIMYGSGDILIISDCQHAEIFQVSNVFVAHGMQKIISIRPLHNLYQQNAEIGRLQVNQYYVEKSNRKNKDGTYVYSLFLHDINNIRTELVEGIHELHFRYVINELDSAIEVAASNVTDWSKVSGVAIEFTVQEPPFNKTWHLFASLAGP